MYSYPVAPDSHGRVLSNGVPPDLTPTVVKTAIYTAFPGDFVPVDATSGAIAVTVSAGPIDGARLAVKKIDSSSNVVTVALGGSDVFNKSGGGTTASLSLQNQALVLQYKASGAIWYVVSTDVPLSALDARYVQPTSPTLTTPVINGTPTGTGVATSASASTVALRDAQSNLTADAFIPGYTTVATAAGTTVLTADSTQDQEATGSSTQTYTLPSTGFVKGQTVEIVNSSSGGNITVNSTSGSNIVNVQPGWACRIKAKIDTPTSFAHWMVIGLFSTSVSFIDKTATANTLVQRTGQGNIAADVFVPSLTAVTTAAGTTVLTVDSTQDQRSTGSTTQTYTLPTTGIGAGWANEFWNQSSSLITINSSAGNLVKILAPGESSRIKAMVPTPTTAADWIATPGRITVRVLTVTQAAIPTFNTDLADVISITGLAQAITSMTTNQTGTPVAGDTLKIQITDNSSPRTIAWGSKFEAPLTLPLPTTTVNSIMLTADFVWNPVSSKWRLLRTDWDPRSVTSQPRVVSTASTGTPAVDAAITDQYELLALAVAITAVSIANPSDGQRVRIRIKDNGTPRAITWGSDFVAGPAALLTITVANMTHLNEFVYDAAALKWVCTLSHAAGY